MEFQTRHGTRFTIKGLSGLSRAEFYRVLKESKDCCPKALRALKGQTLAQFWRTSDKGHWMLWWLTEFVRIKSWNHTETIGHPWWYADGDHRYCGGTEADLARRVRAAYHFDGTRKDKA